MSTGVNKITAERNQKAVLELATKPGNDICADCKSRNPRWASHNLGIFICVNCASIHRKIGTHITKVKSLTLDTWTKEQVESMRQTGNIKSNSQYNPNEVRNPPPTNMVDSERDSELEKFIRDKYEFKRFVSRSAIVSQYLGPSRSAASVGSSASGSSSSSAHAPARSHTIALINKPYTPPPSFTAADLARAPNPPLSAPLRTAPAPAPAPAPVRSFTQPAPAPPQPPPPPSKPAGGVWDDLLALQTPAQQNPIQNSSLPLQYQSAPPTQPMSVPSFATNNRLALGSYGGGTSFGTGASPGMVGAGSSPNFRIGSSVGAGGQALNGGLGSSPFQSQMQMQPPQQSQIAFSGGASFGNPFQQQQHPLLQQQQQQSQALFLSSSPLPSQPPSFSPQPSFVPQQQFTQIQQPAFVPSQGNPFYNGGTHNQRMLTPHPQMVMQSTPSPAPFGSSFQSPQQSHTPFLQSPPPQQFQQTSFQPQQQQQPQFGGMQQPQDTGAGNPFTSWMTRPSGGFAGTAGQWGR